MARRKVKPIDIGYAILGIIGLSMVVGYVRSCGHHADTSPPPALTAAGRPYAEELAHRLTEPGPIWAGYSGLSKAKARCAADAWTMLVGPDELAAMGTTPAQFGIRPMVGTHATHVDWNTANRIEAAYERCGIDPSRLVAANLRRLSADAPQLGASEVDCLTDKMDPSGPKRALILSFTADVGPDGGLTSEDYDLYRWAGNALGQCVKGVDLGN